jgi:hypothetical protein
MISVSFNGFRKPQPDEIISAIFYVIDFADFL